MKKILLTLALSTLLAGGTAFALDVQKYPYTVSEKPQKAPQKAATADGYDIAFCNSIYSWYYAVQKNNTTYRCYIYITPEIATQLAGNKLTEITFSCALTSATQKREGNVFVSEDLEADPVTSTAVSVIDSYEASKTYDQTGVLEEPYVIKENTGFYFGYEVTKCKYNVLTGAADYPIGVDGMDANSFAGYVDIYDKDGVMISQIDMANDIGTNLYLTAKTVGEKNSVENVFTLVDVVLDGFILPVTNNLSDHQVMLAIENQGSNDLTTLNYTATVAGGEKLTKDIEINVPAMSGAYATLPVPDLTAGRGNVGLIINSINGTDCGIAIDLPYVGIEGEGYERKMVVEEGTGTWCGWCPRGIVSLDALSEKYPETFIGVAVHANDDMEVASYLPLAYVFPGFPSCIINRDVIYMVDPDLSTLEQCYNVWQTQTGMAKIDLSVANPADGKVQVTTNTTFAINDDNAMYRLAFAIVQDNIPGVQTNYYSGGQYGECGGWERYAESQPWAYKHVARDIFDVTGLEGSVPETIKAGEAYEYTYEVSLENVYDLKNKNDEVVTDVNNTAIIAMLIDGETSTILNATKVEAKDYGKESGINDIISTNDAQIEYYNIQGMKIDGNSLPSGLYLTRQGNVVKKTIIK